MPDASASRATDAAQATAPAGDGSAPATRLRPADLAGWLAQRPGALVLDARDAQAHTQGHLPGSLRLDGRNHEPLLLRERKTRPVLIYCYHGNASQTYASMFRDFGFTDVADVIGGWHALSATNAPPSAPRPQSTSAAPSAPTSLTERRQSPHPPVPAALATWLTAEGFDAAQPAAPGRHGNTPLMHAAWRGAAEPLEALLALGVPLDAVNHDGNNALWLACVNGEPGLIRRLAAAGVPIDHLNLTGATALMYAASSGKAEVVQTLLELGADPRLTTQDDFSALDMAATLDCLRLLRAATRAPRAASGAATA